MKFVLKQASRAQILKKAAEYITFMKRKNQNHQSGNDDLKRQNNHLDQQSEYIVKILNTNQYINKIDSHSFQFVSWKGN